MHYQVTIVNAIYCRPTFNHRVVDGADIRAEKYLFRDERPQETLTPLEDTINLYRTHRTSAEIARMHPLATVNNKLENIR